MTKQALLEAIKRLITYRSGLSYDDPQQDVVNKKLEKLYEIKWVMYQQEAKA